MSIFASLLASCGIEPNQFDCEANSKLELNGDYAFNGLAEFRSYGIHGLGIINLGDCLLDPPIRDVIFPDGEFDQSMLALNGQAWNEDKTIIAEIEGVISCKPDRLCEAILSKTDDMKIKDQ
ncbi:hypothetical protein [Sphingorhabdus sp. Alg231-15]|uniref:hypothetical protein n=1 Tax=Sphingorhabdus sp. Alg231-15 TaxID=1922222 RepID=UPI000D5519D7